MPSPSAAAGNPEAQNDLGYLGATSLPRAAIAELQGRLEALEVDSAVLTSATATILRIDE